MPDGRPGLSSTALSSQDGTQTQGTIRSNSHGRLLCAARRSVVCQLYREERFVGAPGVPLSCQGTVRTPASVGHIRPVGREGCKPRIIGRLSGGQRDSRPAQVREFRPRRARLGGQRGFRDTARRPDSGCTSDLHAVPLTLHQPVDWERRADRWGCDKPDVLMRRSQAGEPEIVQPLARGPRSAASRAVRGFRHAI